MSTFEQGVSPFHSQDWQAGPDIYLLSVEDTIISWQLFLGKSLPNHNTLVSLLVSCPLEFDKSLDFVVCLVYEKRRVNL